MDNVHHFSTTTALHDGTANNRELSTKHLVWSTLLQSPGTTGGKLPVKVGGSIPLVTVRVKATSFVPVTVPVGRSNMMPAEGLDSVAGGKRGWDQLEVCESWSSGRAGYPDVMKAIPLNLRKTEQREPQVLREKKRKKKFTFYQFIDY